MTDLYDRLPVHQDHNNDPVYTESEIRELSDEVIDLEGNGLLAVSVRDEFLVSFVVFRFSMGLGTDHTGAQVSPRYYERVFHGCGPSGSLRELRHTNWGEPDNSGYIFYPHAKLICDAFKHLKRWFDCD
jgi:hypothetical protein